MRVISWNIKNYKKAKHRTTERLKELYKGEWKGVICLQEVSVDQAKAIKTVIMDTPIYYACEIWPRSSYRIQKWGNLTILKNMSGHNAHVLQFLPHPEKSLIVTVEANNRMVDIINFHSVTGVGHLDKKGKQYNSIFNYIMASGEYIILCGDMNEPKIDSIYYEKIECWSRAPGNREAAESIFKGQNVHDMVDAHIEYARRYGGNLNPTYRSRSNDRRYDHIFVRGHKSISQFRVEPLEESVSDHAFVSCDIQF